MIRTLLRSGPVTLVAFVVVVLAALLAAFGPLLHPDATRNDVLASLLPPGSPGHLLGTDLLGRDVLALSVAGARSALLGPVMVAFGAAVLGTALGGIAGWYRGWLDFVLSRIVDLLLSLPVVLVAIVVVGVLGSGYWINVLLLVFLFLPGDFRLVRAAVIEQATRPYVGAALLGGTSRFRVLWRHVLPNVWSIELANFLVNIAFAIFSMAALSFLGLGVPVGAADWGLQLTDAKDLFSSNAAAILTPAVLIIAVTCSVNILGDWIAVRTERGDDAG